MHYHTIDLKHYLSMPFAKRKGVTVGYVHFLPETIEGSIKLPKLIKKIFYKYIINFYNNMDYLVTVNPNFITKLEAYNIDRKKIPIFLILFQLKNFIIFQLRINI